LVRRQNDLDPLPSVEGLGSGAKNARPTEAQGAFAEAGKRPALTWHEENGAGVKSFRSRAVEIHRLPLRRRLPAVPRAKRFRGRKPVGLRHREEKVGAGPDRRRTHLKEKGWRPSR